jgi:hypothetical protein
MGQAPIYMSGKINRKASFLDHLKREDVEICSLAYLCSANRNSILTATGIRKHGKIKNLFYACGWTCDKVIKF